MKHNRLGTSGLFVSELSFGTMTFGENAGQPTLGSLTQLDASAMVAKAFEAGVNLFDTADVYALGDSERFLGEALRNLGVPRSERQHEQSRPAILAALRSTHHRTAAVVYLCFFSRCRDHDARCFPASRAAKLLTKRFTA
jgi:predicted oxidoreductase